MQFKLFSVLTILVIGCSMLTNGKFNRKIPPLPFDKLLFNLDASIWKNFPALSKLSRNLTQQYHCYEPELVGQNVNLFERKATFRSIVNQYYQIFPHKTVTHNSIANLVSSIAQIINSCLETKLSTIRFGFTELSDKSNSQIQGLTGSRPFNTSNQPIGLPILDGSDVKCRKNVSHIPPEYDWSKHGVVTSVKNQGHCGSCWAFSAVASIESAYLVNRKSADINFTLSEQQLVDCAKKDGCHGGNSNVAFEYVRTHGLTSNSKYPYRATDNRCNDRQVPVVARISGYCIRSLFNGKPEILTDIEIQRALVAYGPLYILVDASPAWSQNYRGGIVNGRCSTKVNHAVLVVGYTSDAWIIKNSWGKHWGMSGYFQLARGHNQCGINTEIAFPLL